MYQPTTNKICPDSCRHGSCRHGSCRHGSCLHEPSPRTIAAQQWETILHANQYDKCDLNSETEAKKFADFIEKITAGVEIPDHNFRPSEQEMQAIIRTYGLPHLDYRPPPRFVSPRTGKRPWFVPSRTISQSIINQSPPNKTIQKMKTFSKIIATLFVALILSYAGYGIVKAAFGNYVQNASFITTGLIILSFTAFVYLCFKGIRYLWTLSILFAFIATGCNYAKSNQQVLVSTDCGMTWNAIDAGDAVPKGTMNPCYMKVVIPNFPMQGESKFIGNLKDRVKVNVEIDYDYSITNGLAFIKEAKSLGKANVDADADEALNSSAFESAENRVIDKRIREIAKGLFLNEDIVDMEQADLEEKLEVESNKLLEKYGVKLNFLTLTFIPDEQTRQAIDVATASRIYESKGLKDVGEKVMTARAGAPKVIVENKTESIQKAE